jgi:uncharacterized protein
MNMGENSMSVIAPVTSFAAAIAVVMQFIMTGMTGMQRQKTQTPIGNGSDETLFRRIRAHGNFIETVPMALIILGLLELRGTGTAVLWAYAASLLIGRTLHAFSILRAIMPLRPVSMMMTFIPMLAGAVSLLWANYHS